MQHQQQSGWLNKNQSRALTNSRFSYISCLSMHTHASQHVNTLKILSLYVTFSFFSLFVQLQKFESLDSNLSLSKPKSHLYSTNSNSVPRMRLLALIALVCTVVPACIGTPDLNRLFTESLAETLAETRAHNTRARRNAADDSSDDSRYSYHASNPRKSALQPTTTLPFSTTLLFTQTRSVPPPRTRSD